MLRLSLVPADSLDCKYAKYRDGAAPPISLQVRCNLIHKHKLKLCELPKGTESELKLSGPASDCSLLSNISVAVEDISVHSGSKCRANRIPRDFNSERWETDGLIGKCVHPRLKRRNIWAGRPQISEPASATIRAINVRQEWTLASTAIPTCRRFKNTASTNHFDPRLRDHHGPGSRELTSMDHRASLL